MTWLYAVGFLPVGVIVWLLHDVSGIPLDMLKMANYLKLEGACGLFLSELLFVAFVVNWDYFRLYLLPTKLLYTTLVENRMRLEDAHDFTNLPTVVAAFQRAARRALYLHIWWGFLIVRFVVGVVAKGAHETGKDEYEGSSSDSEAEHVVKGD
uniref:TLC domain-containing protein n=1 Tax=Globisporangium ultimum (strain ATCC 200006 / CBS 805.95 / DAOM BR144) TaxID=431595 RepID=K3X2W5_GLOUD